MNQLFNTQLITALAGVSLLAWTGIMPAIAQPEGLCDDPGVVEAADTTRDLELEQFGLELTIPSNYRAILLNNGNVQIVDPGTYELLTCIARGGEALGRGYGRTLVRTVENPDNLGLRQLVEQNIRENQEISPYTFEGQDGYLVTPAPVDESVGIPDSFAEFWLDVDNVPGAVVISRICDCPGQRDRLVSLLDRSSLLNSSQSLSQ